MIYIYDGKILTADGGKIAVAEACCCEAGGPCPTDCSSLPSYNATVSSLAGDSCLTCLADYTGTWTLTRSGCVWSVLDITYISYVYIEVSCATNLWTGLVDFNCYDPGAECGIFQTITGTIPSKANPTGTYNLSGGGITGTMVIA